MAIVVAYPVPRGFVVAASNLGSFLDERWDRGEIEFLFLDICKLPELNGNALAEFVPHRVPGESLLIQQDFFHEFHPHIHLSMQYLKPYFQTNCLELTRRVYTDWTEGNAMRDRSKRQTSSGS